MARDTVAGFFAAYSDGRFEQAVHEHVAGVRLEWISATIGDQHHVEGHPNGVADMLREVHTLLPMLHLEDFRWTGFRWADYTGHFGLSLSASDGREIVGKGAINCGTGRLMVLSIAG
jgi:hypothetical protein